MFLFFKKKEVQQQVITIRDEWGVLHTFPKGLKGAPSSLTDQEIANQLGTTKITVTKEKERLE